MTDDDLQTSPKKKPNARVPLHQDRCIDWASLLADMEMKKHNQYELATLTFVHICYIAVLYAHSPFEGTNVIVIFAPSWPRLVPRGPLYISI